MRSWASQPLTVLKLRSSLFRGEMTPTSTGAGHHLGDGRDCPARGGWAQGGRASYDAVAMLARSAESHCERREWGFSPAPTIIFCKDDGRRSDNM